MDPDNSENIYQLIADEINTPELNSNIMPKKMLNIQPNSSINVDPNSTVLRIENSVDRETKLTQFNGNQADWPAFRDRFIAEVHKKAYDPVRKLLYLQQACIEKAADTLGPWQPTSNNYEIAWEELKRAYDDDYHVIHGIHGILGRMYKVTSQERETYESLKRVLDALSSGTRQLYTVTSRTVLWDQTWIHYAKQRLPKYTLGSWEQHRNRDGQNRIPTLDEFRKFLEIKATGKREFETEQPLKIFKQEPISIKRYDDRNKPTANQYKKPYDQNLYNKNRQEQYENKCAMRNCNQNHPIYL